MEEGFVIFIRKIRINPSVIKAIIVVVLTILIPTSVTLLASYESSAIDSIKLGPSESFIISTTDKTTEKMDIEMFVICVLMERMNIDDHEENLKAMTVIIRTEIAYKMQGLSSINAKNLDMPYVTIKSLKKKWGNAFAKNYEHLVGIVNSTSLKTIKYKGEVINPLYHFASAGMTRTGSSDYIRAVESDGDYEYSDYLKKKYLTNGEFYGIVTTKKDGVNISDESPLRALQIVERDISGYVVSLEVGGVRMSGEEFASFFGLASTNFTVEEYRGNVRIITKGVGSGYGYSIYGAGVLARAGQTYTQLLNYYYTDVVVE